MRRPPGLGTFGISVVTRPSGVRRSISFAPLFEISIPPVASGSRFSSTPRPLATVRTFHLAHPGALAAPACPVTPNATASTTAITPAALPPIRCTIHRVVSTARRYFVDDERRPLDPRAKLTRE